MNMSGPIEFTSSSKAWENLRRKAATTKAQELREKLAKDTQQIRDRNKGTTEDTSPSTCPGLSDLLKKGSSAKLERDGIQMLLNYLTTATAVTTATASDSDSDNHSDIDISNAYFSCKTLLDCLEKRRMEKLLPHVFGVLRKNHYLEYVQDPRYEEEHTSKAVLNLRLVSKSWKDAADAQFLTPVGFSQPDWHLMKNYRNKLMPSPFKCNFEKVVDIESAMKALGSKSKHLSSSSDCSYPSIKIDEPQTLQMLHEEIFCDLTISAANGAEVRAHRVYVAASSPVLRTMLEKNTKESIDMKETSEKGVRAFLQYLYGRDLTGPREDVEVAYELLCAGNTFKLPKLAILMATLLEDADDKDFDVKLAFRLYSFVQVCNPSSSLKAKALRILKSKWDELEATEEYLELFKDGRKLETAKTFFGDVAKSQIDYCDKPATKTFSAPENEKESTAGNAPEVVSGKMQESDDELHGRTDCDHDRAFDKAKDIHPDDDNDAKSGPCPCQVDLLLPEKMTEIQVALQQRISALEAALFHSEMEIKHFKFKTETYKEEICRLKMTISAKATKQRGYD